MTSVIDRRTFLAGTGAVLLAAPLAAEAQPEWKRPRIALLFANTPAADITGPRPVLREARAFLDGMRDLGWLAPAGEQQKEELSSRSSVPPLDKESPDCRAGQTL
jgi:hypothetical protein